MENFENPIKSRRNFLGKIGLSSLLLGVGGNMFGSGAKLDGRTTAVKNLIWNPYEFGAKGDGKTVDTKAIQAAVDSCYSSGGGKVLLYGGTFVSGTIILRSNITLHVEAGARLRGSNDLDDFPIFPSQYPSYTGTFVTNKMMIYAEDAQNITISGRGTIDGNGDYWLNGPYGSPSFSIRPRIIHFRGCENVHVHDITLYNSASWVQTYQSCTNMVIEGITVESRENSQIEKERYADAPGRNTDGLDLLDCQNVRIANCYINSGDDAICFKSLSPDGICGDITVSNCIISSNASGIKIGTETAGAFQDITIQNCVIFDLRAEAIALLTADGARIERINISNITLRNIKGAAIAIRLGVRNRAYRKNVKINQPELKDILIENIQGTRISTDYGCSVTGIKNIPVENIVLRNISLLFEGGGKRENSYREIPEHEEGYPSGRTFGRIPAFGFFIRHANNVTLENIHLRFIKDDDRPPLVCKNVVGLEIKDLKAQATNQTPELIRLINAKDVIIAESLPLTPVSVFVSVEGTETDKIVLLNNRLKNAAQNIVIEEELKKNTVTVIGTIN